MGERVVVTGGAGFIGSHVADALVARGDDVHVIDDLSTGRRDHVPSTASLHELDIADVAGLHALATSIGPVDRWYHLAAQADVRVSIEDPERDARVNVLGTISVLNAARQHGAPVAFASTGGAIYGEVDGPAREDHAQLPPSPYGAAKLAGEVFVAQDSRLGGSSHAVLRFANVYGPRQDPHGEAGVVAIFAGRVLEGVAARIYGDGAQTRDYVYVGDVVEATIAAADAARDGSDADLRNGGVCVPVYNVGTGIETSVLELWHAVQRVCGTDLDHELHAARDGEILRSVLDPARVRTRLGVGCATSLADGLGQTVHWMRARAGAQTPG